MTSTPEFLPILSSGAHADPKEGACVMEYVSFLAGEEFSDRPKCTDPVLASMARQVNDSLSDADRQRLLPLVPRVIGTAQSGDTRALHVRLACWCARQVLDLVRESDRAVCLAAIEAAEGWCRGEVSEREVRDAAAAANAAAAAAYAAAYAATNAAANAAYAAANAAYAANAAEADQRVAMFTGLLDEFDRLTGRTQPEPLTSEQLRGMAELTA